MRASDAAIVAAFIVSTPAFARDITDPPPPLSIGGSATLVSDYRFRGISQTDRRTAVQGSIALTHESGFYATMWGSSIDDYVANGGDAELDMIAGFRKTVRGTTFDAGLLYYVYPGHGGANTDFVEPYVSVSHIFGPVTAKATVNYAPKQRALSVGNGKEDNLYLAGDLGAGVPGTPLSLSAHLGHSFGPSYLVPHGKGYTDWAFGASYTRSALTLGISYVDTYTTCFLKPGSRRNQGGAGVVGSIGVSF